MFKFNFDIDDADDADEFLPLGIEHNDAQIQPKMVSSTKLEPFSEISLSQLLDALPDLISYSPLFTPLSSSRKATTLVRRDLFDARFQLISEGAGDTVDDVAPEGSEAENNTESSKAGRQALAFLDAPFDLVPGVYEGGLKTWECSLDLVDYLDSLKDTPTFNTYVGKRILELGCGTGVPSMYIFRELLSSLPSSKTSVSETEIHLQDYNASVLQLVTLPNILLTWYASHHAEAYRSSINDEEVAPIISPTDPGVLPITPRLKTAFLHSIDSLNISLRFFSGSWDTFNPVDTGGPTGYDVVLTSETIYCTESLDPLIDLLQTASTGEHHSTLANLVSAHLKLEDTIADKNPDRDHLCLVAAKVLYFGVGGGVSDFLKKVEGRNGKASTVLERSVGVGRVITRICWPNASLHLI